MPCHPNRECVGGDEGGANAFKVIVIFLEYRVSALVLRGNGLPWLCVKWSIKFTPLKRTAALTTTMTLPTDNIVLHCTLCLNVSGGDLDHQSCDAMNAISQFLPKTVGQQCAGNQTQCQQCMFKTYYISYISYS